MNYANLGHAVEFYRDRGYAYIEDAPWLVGRSAYYATKPDGAVDMIMEAWQGQVIERKFLVASGEQSFIQMMLDGQDLKRAICVTPCYRWEPRVDMLHRQYFMKAELINAHDVDRGHLLHMVHEALSFFEEFVPVRVVETGPDSYDIVEKSTRFELGSYGIRALVLTDQQPTKTIRWIYGTACAEPRLSIAVDKFSRNAGR